MNWILDEEEILFDFYWKISFLIINFVILLILNIKIWINEVNKTMK